MDFNFSVSDVLIEEEFFSCLAEELAVDGVAGADGEINCNHSIMRFRLYNKKPRRARGR